MNLKEKAIPHIFRNKYLKGQGGTVILGGSGGGSYSSSTGSNGDSDLDLGNLSDVTIDYLSNGDHLIYDEVLGVWKNSPVKDLSWNNITNTPTTLEGYGITNAVSKDLFNEKMEYYYTKSEVDEKIEDNNTEIDSKLEDLQENIDEVAKDLKDNYYNKTEVDGKIDEVYDHLEENYYTKEEVYNKVEIDEKVDDLKDKIKKTSFISPCSNGYIKPTAGSTSTTPLPSVYAYGVIIDTGKPFDNRTKPVKVILSGQIYKMARYCTGDTKWDSYESYTNNKIENLYSIIYIAPPFEDNTDRIFSTKVEHYGYDSKEDFYIINYNGNLGIYWDLEHNKSGRGSADSIQEIFDFGVKIPEIDEFSQTNTMSSIFLSQKDLIDIHKDEASNYGVSSISQIKEYICPQKGDGEVFSIEVKNDQYYQVFSLRNATNFDDYDTYLSLFVDAVITDADTGELVLEEPGAFVDLWYDSKKVVYEVISPANTSHNLGNIVMGFPVFDDIPSGKLTNVMAFFKASWSKTGSLNTWFSSKKVYLRFKILNKSKYTGRNIFINPVRKSDPVGHTYGLQDDGGYASSSRGGQYSKVKEVYFYDLESYKTNKLDILDTYTKDEIDGKLEDLHSDIINGTELVNYYTKTDVDNKIKEILPNPDVITDPETEASETYYIEEKGIYSIFKTSYEGDYLVSIVCQADYTESYTFLYNCINSTSSYSRLTLINGVTNKDGYLGGIGCNRSGTLYLDIRGESKFWIITIKSLSDDNIVKSGSGASVLSLTKIAESYLDINKFYRDLININLIHGGSGYYSTEGSITLLDGGISFNGDLYNKEGDIVTDNGIVRGNEYKLNYNSKVIPLIDDSLTSYNNFQALSANQGRVLNEKINDILYIGENLDSYYTKEQVDNIELGLSNRIDNTRGYIDNNFYTKSKVDQLISEIEVPEIPEIPELPDMTNYYNKAEVDALINGIEITASGGSKTVTYSLERYKYTKILSVPSSSSSTVNLTICSNALNGRIAVFQISHSNTVSGITIEQLTGVGNNGYGDIYYKYDSKNLIYDIYLENPYATNNVTLVASGCNFIIYDTPTTISSSTGYTRFETENLGMVTYGMKTDYKVQSYQNFSQKYYVITPNETGTYDSYDLIEYIKNLESRISALEGNGGA